MHNTTITAAGLLVSGLLAATVQAATTLPNKALYVSNGGDGTIRKVASDGSMQVVASGLRTPRGLVFDTQDNLYVACAGDNTIYKITPTGQRSAYASSIPNLYGLAIHSNGSLFAVDNGGAIAPGSLYQIDPLGTVSMFAPVEHGGGVVIRDNDIYVTKALSNIEVPEGIGGIYHVSLSGIVSTFVGEMSDPIGLAIDPSGNLYAAEFVTPNEILKVTPAGITQTYATGTFLGTPYGLAFDDAGLLYAADFTGDRINTITPDGTVSVFVEGLDSPRFMTFGPEVTAIPEAHSGLLLALTSVMLVFGRTRR
jgi:sugar lactone lactonase YvrE